MQEQLPSLHAVNEHFFGKFNDARASKVIFQRFPSSSGIIFGEISRLYME